MDETGGVEGGVAKQSEEDAFPVALQFKSSITCSQVPGRRLGLEDA